MRHVGKYFKETKKKITLKTKKSFIHAYYYLSTAETDFSFVLLEVETLETQKDLFHISKGTLKALDLW